MLDFKTFITLLLEKEKVGGIPPIRFKSNTSFSDPIKKLVGVGTFYPSIYSPAMVTKELMNELITAQLGTIETEGVFSSLDDIVESFVAKLSMVTSSINEIKTDVDLLSEEITNRINDTIAADPFASIHLGHDTFNTEFQKISWEDYSSIGSDNQIITTVHDKLGITDYSMASNSNISLMFRKLTIAPFEHDNITLEKDRLEEIITTLITECPELLSDDIRDCVKILTDTTRALRFKNNVLNVGATPAYVPTILFYLRFLRQLPKIMNLLMNGTFDFSNTTQASLTKNIESINQYLLTMGYCLVYARNTAFKSTLILPGLLINGDVYPEFKALEGTDLMIAHHLNYLFKDGVLPDRGVSLTSVIDMAPGIKKKVTESSHNVATRLKIITNDATRAASKYVLSTYLQKIKADGTKSITITNPNKFIGNMCELLITQNMVMADMLYEAIIGLFYKNTFVEIMYRRLGAEYLKLVSIKDDVSEEDVIISEITVLTDLVCEFICKFVEPV